MTKVAIIVAAGAGLCCAVGAACCVAGICPWG